MRRGSITKKKFDGKQIPITFCLILFTITTLFPLIMTIILSLKGGADFDKGIWSLPSSLHFENYRFSMSIMNVNMINSFLI